MHHIKEPCKISCKKQCSSKIKVERQIEINFMYWKLKDVKERKSFICKNIKQSSIENKTENKNANDESKRSKIFTYHLPSKSGELIEVCKLFFMATLGYAKHNDRLIRLATIHLKNESVDSTKKTQSKKSKDMPENDKSADEKQESKKTDKLKRGDVSCEDSQDDEESAEEWSSSCTKDGKLRFRKMSKDKKTSESNEPVRTHRVKGSCRKTCKKGCSSKINAKRQNEINSMYWSLKLAKDRKLFVNKHISHGCVKRRTTDKDESRRNFTFIYKLPSKNVEPVEVCKTFFMSTLGYAKNNDKIIRHAMENMKRGTSPDVEEKRGKYKRNSQRDSIVAHVESYWPRDSHYRHNHDPETRYLPSDVTIVQMYQDYMEKHPDLKYTYQGFRKIVAEMKISCAKFEIEECSLCEKFDIHAAEVGHSKDDLNVETCPECDSYNKHKLKFISASREYKLDMTIEGRTTKRSFFSANLQKVIMLPRCEMFKEVRFMPRLIAFNKSFVPLGSTDFQNGKYPLAVIWHEAIAGRSMQDIISVFYAFFLHYNNKEQITLWLDNCIDQNKNWTLLAFFVYIVNSNETKLKNFEIKYFESGHILTSVDLFHQQVEKTLRGKTHLWDLIWNFNDFRDCVFSIERSTVVHEMKIDDFIDWNDLVRDKLKSIDGENLNRIVHMHFSRGNFNLKYKNDFQDSIFAKLDFINEKFYENGIFEIRENSRRKTNRGIPVIRKADLIARLKKITAPGNRMIFWENLPTCSEEKSLDD